MNFAATVHYAQAEEDDFEYGALHKETRQLIGLPSQATGLLFTVCSYLQNG